MVPKTTFPTQMTWLALSVIFWMSPGPALAAEPPVLRELSGAERAHTAKLLAGAQKENEIVIITNSLDPPFAQALYKDFQEYYGLGHIRMRHTMKRSGGVISTLRNDISAGRHSFDLLQVGSPDFFHQLLQRKALMKYGSPAYNNFIPEVTGEKKGADGAVGYYISGQVNISSILYNTKYVKKEIKTWDDVLDPQFNGKIIVSEITKSGTISYVYVGMRQILPRSYFEKLAKMDPIFILAQRESVQKVATGEKWIALPITSGLAYPDWKRGAPLKVVFPEGRTVALGYPFGILAKAPNPNTAKLFIDYLHGKRGHLKWMMLKAASTGMRGIQLPSDITAFSPPLERLKIVPMEWERIGKEMNNWKEEYRQIFYTK